MRTGRYSYNAKQRSIVRPIQKSQKLAECFAQNYDGAVMESVGCAKEMSLKNKKGANDIRVNEKCTNEKSTGKKNIVVASAMMAVQKKEDIELTFYRACNVIFSQHGKPCLVNASFVWPEDSEEALMAELTAHLAALCKRENIQLGAVTASVSSFVQRGIVTISAVGETTVLHTDIFDSFVQEGSTLCMAGHAGLAGIGLLASAGEEALTKQYTQGFIRQAQKFLTQLSLRPVKEALSEIDSCIYPVQEGGVLTALWNFADGAGIGLDVDMRKIPIRQESVEISEFYGINPYQLMGDGACLIASTQPEKVCAALAQAGVFCCIIGQITGEHARIIRRDDEVRYLDKPAQDELKRSGLDFRI